MVEPCKYGLQCYRKRPEHFLQYSHPDNHPTIAQLGLKLGEKRKHDTSDVLKPKKSKNDVQNTSGVLTESKESSKDEVSQIKIKIFRQFWLKISDRHFSKLSRLHFNFIKE